MLIGVVVSGRLRTRHVIVGGSRDGAKWCDGRRIEASGVRALMLTCVIRDL
jgi:hypothetical protein